MKFIKFIKITKLFEVVKSVFTCNNSNNLVKINSLYTLKSNRTFEAIYEILEVFNLKVTVKDDNKFWIPWKIVHVPTVAIRRYSTLRNDKIQIMSVDEFLQNYCEAKVN